VAHVPGETGSRPRPTAIRALVTTSISPTRSLHSVILHFVTAPLTPSDSCVPTTAAYQESIERPALLYHLLVNLLTFVTLPISNLGPAPPFINSLLPFVFIQFFATFKSPVN